MRRRRKALVIAAVATCIVVAVVFIRDDRSERHNIVLISVDTLGAKHMGCYGCFRDTSPHMDALAREGVLFTRAIAQSPWTLTSHVSLLTSLYPATHKVITERVGIDPAIRTLAEVLHDDGYSTAAFVDCLLVSSRFGFDQGFDLYDDTKGGIERINEKVRSWLAEHSSRPFFLFYHVYDVHCPYTPPRPYFNMYSPDYAGSLDLTGKCGKTHLNKMPLSDADVEYITANYDAGVRYTDEHLGELFRMLESFGLRGNTIVALLSDHGEEFMEHGRIGHGHTVYDEVLHVPLIIRTPDEPMPGRRIDGPVRLIDVAPTLLGLVGIEPDRAFQGVSLVPHLRGDQTPHLAALAEVNRADRLGHCLYQDGHHLILSTSPRKMELYDVENDPLEQENLAHEEEALARAMGTRLRTLLKEAKAAGSSYRPRPLTLDREQVERLRALGYAD